MKNDLKYIGDDLVFGEGLEVVLVLDCPHRWNIDLQAIIWRGIQRSELIGIQRNPMIIR